jgi:hypothetical protein
MLERIELHAQALAYARMFHRPYSVIRKANNGQFELVQTYNMPENLNEKIAEKLMQRMLQLV